MGIPLRLLRCPPRAPLTLETGVVVAPVDTDVAKDEDDEAFDFSCGLYIFAVGVACGDDNPMLLVRGREVPVRSDGEGRQSEDKVREWRWRVELPSALTLARCALMACRASASTCRDLFTTLLMPAKALRALFLASASRAAWDVGE